MFNYIWDNAPTNKSLKAHHLSPDIRITIRKVSGARAADESAIGIWVGMLIADLGLLLLLESAATLDLARLQLDGGVLNQSDKLASC